MLETTRVMTSSYTARRPFAGTRTSGYRPTPADAPKDTHHHVISLAGSGITYKPGDSLGVWARNPEPLVDAVLTRLAARGDEIVKAGGHGEMPFAEALSRVYDLSIVSRRLLEACVAQGSG